MFDSIIFLFQSDGYKSYMNGCVFILEATSLRQAKEKQEMLYRTLYTKRTVPFVYFSYFPDDALADTSYSADLTDTGSIIFRHTDDAVAVVFRVMLNLGKIVVAADSMKIFTHLFVSNSYGGLVAEVEDVERLRERLVDQGCQIFS